MGRLARRRGQHNNLSTEVESRSAGTANKALNKNATIWDPSWPGAGSAAIANKASNKDATIWEPSRPGAKSARRLIRIRPFGSPAGPGPVLLQPGRLDSATVTHFQPGRLDSTTVTHFRPGRLDSATVTHFQPGRLDSTTVTHFRPGGADLARVQICWNC